jgi:hypothetical protein
VPRPPGNYPGYPGHGHGGYYPGWGYGWGAYPFYGYYGAFYGPWWGWGWGWGYPGYRYGYGYGYGYYGPYGPYYYVDNTASLRLQVTPREAEVFVNGSYAGLVDEFDGNFQRLRLPPGDHEIQIYLQGYKSLTERVMLTVGTTTKIRAALEPLAAGAEQDPRPTPKTPVAQPAPRTDPHEPGMPERGAPVEGTWTGRRAPSTSIQVASNFGALAIRVQPPGADVLIDGERWQGPEGQQRLTVEVAEGRHRVEVRKDGYQSYVADVEVRRGDVTTLNVSLLARE